MFQDGPIAQQISANAGGLAYRISRSSATTADYGVFTGVLRPSLRPADPSTRSLDRNGNNFHNWSMTAQHQDSCDRGAFGSEYH